jgi:hypothetical protein
VGCFECIGRGFRLVHLNWQLVLIQVALALINILVLVMIVGIPAVAVFVALGMDIQDLGGLQQTLMNLQDPVDLVLEYLGLVLVVVFCFVVYLCVWFIIWAYVLGGTLGVLRNSLLEPSEAFSMQSFFSGAGRLFMPLLWYMTLVGLALTGVVLAIVMLGGVSAASLNYLFPGEGAFAMFIRVLTVTVIGATGTIIVLMLLAISVVGIAVLAFEGRGAVKALGGAYGYIARHSGVVWLLVVLFLGHTAIQLAVGLFGAGINLIGGVVLSIPYQFVGKVFQGYISFVVMASIMAHYHFTCAGSMRDSGTFEEAFPQAPPPRQTDGI